VTRHGTVNCTAVHKQLAKLRKAQAATEKLLYGDLANMACKVAVQPDLAEHEPQLATLSDVFEFNCIELAKILSSGPNLLPGSKPVEDATQFLMGVRNLPPQFQNFSGFNVIQDAVKSGDVKFFITLGQRLRDLSRRRARTAQDGLLNLRLSFAYWWKPHGDWPGLAYCKNTARMEFLVLLERQNLLQYPFAREMSPKNFDNIWRRLGLVCARQPFISRIQALRAGSKIHLRFS
jgi:hypothetical protein